MTAAALASLTVALLAVIPGCGSSPEPVYFALAPTHGATQPSAIKSVKLRRPGLAGYLDRPEIVRRVVDYKLGVTTNERWGEPLDVMIGRVLAQDLEARAPECHVFNEDGAITADPEATVEIDILRFDVGEDGEVNLVSEIAVEHGQGHSATGARSVHLHMRPNGANTSALVKTMSDLLGQLSDNVAAVLRGS